MNLLFQIVQLEMIITNNKKPDISMHTAVTVGSLCPAYTVILKGTARRQLAVDLHFEGECLFDFLLKNDARGYKKIIA
jgi:hypothetical protein